MPDTPLNPDGVLNAMDTLMAETDADARATEWARKVTTRVLEGYFAAALPEVTSKVEAFINQRPEYIQALKNTRSGDDMSDYSRWNGHAESRRKLAQALGWTVPHNPGETTRPEVNDA